jgi:drug/metabolite transporter (DMT)-like permease
MNDVKNMLKNLWSRAYILLTIGACFWAGNAIVGRAARDVVPPMALSFSRWTLALVILLPFAWPHLKRDWPKLKANWPVVLAMGVIGIGMFNSFLYTGLANTTAMNGLLIQSAQPAVILGLGALFMGDQIGRWQWAGLALSLGGVSVILTQGHPEILLNMRLNKGDALIATGLLAWGIYSILLRKRPMVHPMSFLAATIICGLMLVTPLFLWEYAEGARTQMGWDAALAMLYVGIFPSLIAYMFFNRGVELLGSAQAGLFMNVMPLIGAGLAILLLGEELRLFHIAGLVMVLGGVLLARRVTRPKPKAAPE